MYAWQLTLTLVELSRHSAVHDISRKGQDIEDGAELPVVICYVTARQHERNPQISDQIGIVQQDPPGRARRPVLLHYWLLRARLHHLDLVNSVGIYPKP